jgi:uncharacterized protein YqkB
MSEQWALLTTVYSGLEADTTRATLESEGIPVLVRGYQVGMFGSGFQGPINEGAKILVPESALDRARELVVDFDEDADSSSDSNPAFDE